MANRHYYGGNGAPIGLQWGTLTTSWLVVGAYLLTVIGSGLAQSVFGSAGGSLLAMVGSFVAFVVWYGLISLLALSILLLGLLTLFRGMRGTGPRPWNATFWIELMPALVIAGAMAWHICEVTYLE